MSNPLDKLLSNFASKNNISKRKYVRGTKNPTTNECSLDLENDVTSPSEVILDKQKYKRETEKISKEFLSAIPEAPLGSITYSFDSFEDMKRLAGDTIIDSSDITGKTLIGTLNDPKLGVIDANKKCSKCRQISTYCMGHYGLIELPVPRLNPNKDVIKRIIKVLNSICISCGSLKLSEEQLKDKNIFNKNGLDRLKLIEKYSKDIPCNKPASIIDGKEFERCNRDLIFLTNESETDRKIKYKINKSDTVIEELVPEKLFTILDAISDEDAKILGFEEGNHPRDFILRGIIVTPICARPSAVVDGNLKENDITKLYVAVLKEVERLNILKKEKRKNTPEFQNKLDSLDFAIAELFSVKNKGDTRTNRPRGPKDLLSGKDGLIRKNIQGKRTNYSGRAVLSTDPSLRPDQINIPFEIAKNLTPEELVTTDNIGRMRELLKEGKITKIAKKVGENYYNLIVNDKDAKEKISIEIGDKVLRHLMPGDYVMYYRNPSLTKQSIMGAQVKEITMDRTVIDIPISVAKPLNGDFDGDELNVHIVQDPEAIQEVKNLINVKNMVISSQDNNPNISNHFDAISSVFLLTDPDTFVQPDQFIKYIELVVPPVDVVEFSERLKYFKVPVDSGRAVFSSVLPKDFYYQVGDVNIQKGILISGVISAKQIGRSNINTIGQSLVKEYDNEEFVRFIYNIGRICDKFLAERGLTVSIKDVIPNDKRIKEEVMKQFIKANLLIKAFGDGSDPRERVVQERAIETYLSGVTAVSDKIVKELLPDDNNLKIMATSGAKGKTIDVSQAVGTLGQQIVGDGRPKPTMNKGRRCMPYFEEDSVDPRARGFCLNSFSEGTNIAEFAAEAMASRLGLIDTANTTANVGYLKNKIEKSMEDVKVGKDNSVINSNDSIIQLIYGFDSFDPKNLETVVTDFGIIPMFTNIERTIGKINNSFGYIKDSKGDWISG